MEGITGEIKMKLDNYQIVLILLILACIGILLKCYSVDVRGYKSVFEQCKQLSGIVVKDENDKYICIRENWRK